MKRALPEILLLPESPERTAALAEWLQSLDPDSLILVGGAAVELYTGGAYSTSDLDFVGSLSPSAESELESAGFRKIGRHWAHEEARVFLEFPGTQLDEGAGSVDLQIAGCTVRVIAPEALIVDRLSAWQHWSSERDAVNAFLVHRSSPTDDRSLTDLAKRSEVLPALESLRRALRRWESEEPSPEDLRKWARRIPGE